MRYAAGEPEARGILAVKVNGATVANCVEVDTENGWAEFFTGRTLPLLHTLERRRVHGHVVLEWADCARCGHRHGDHVDGTGACRHSWPDGPSCFDRCTCTTYVAP